MSWNPKDEVHEINKGNLVGQVLKLPAFALRKQGTMKTRKHEYIDGQSHIFWWLHRLKIFKRNIIKKYEK